MNKAGLIQLANANYLTNAVAGVLLKNYKKITIRTIGNVNSPDSVTIDVQKLDSKDKDRLYLDIQFLSQNPNIPLENVCNQLENYRPKNETQEELMFWARELLKLDVSTTAAGLFMQGDVGVGKTHVSIGLTKEFMRRGLEAHYLSMDNAQNPSNAFNEDLLLKAGKVFVLDDLNSPFGAGMPIFKKVALNVHEKGGLVFVTSNSSLDGLLAHGFITDREDEARYRDRIKGMFKVVTIEGESARKGKRWY